MHSFIFFLWYYILYNQEESKTTSQFERSVTCWSMSSDLGSYFNFMLCPNPHSLTDELFKTLLLFNYVNMHVVIIPLYYWLLVLNKCNSWSLCSSHANHFLSINEPRKLEAFMLQLIFDLILLCLESIYQSFSFGILSHNIFHHQYFRCYQHYIPVPVLPNTSQILLLTPVWPTV